MNVESADSNIVLIPSSGEIPAPVVEIYCDGSISDAVMLDPLHSELSGEFVGRVVVLAPALDLGFIQKVREGILTCRGRPNSTYVELFAIRMAMSCCFAWDVKEVVIYNDNQGAVSEAHAGDERVQWKPRGEMYLPNAYFEGVLDRASYLRVSEGKVRARQPVEPHHREIFELLQTERREFRLSESTLWKRINDRLDKHPQALRQPFANIPTVT